MAKYMFVYSGGKGVAADEAERNAQYARWGQWFGELGSAVVDGGAATGAAKTVGPGGSVSDGGSRGLTGYSIVSADSLDVGGRAREGLPGPRDRRRGRRLRSDRDVAGARGAGSARTAGPELDPARAAGLAGRGVWAPHGGGAPRAGAHAPLAHDVHQRRHLHVGSADARQVH